MAMINCPECGKEISDKAKVCPSCGAPAKSVQEKSKKRKDIVVFAVIIVVFIAAVAACIGGAYLHEMKVQEQYRQNFRNSENGRALTSMHEEVEKSRESISKIRDELGS